MAPAALGKPLARNQAAEPHLRVYVTKCHQPQKSRLAPVFRSLNLPFKTLTSSMAQPSVINSTNEQIPCDPTGDVSDESDTQSEVTSRPTTPNLPDPVEQNGRDGESENDQSPAGPADGTMAIGCGQVLRVQLISSPSKLPTPAPKQIEHPQEKISKLWKNFEPEYQGKVTRVLPDLLANQTDVQKASLERQQSQKAAKSYEEARAECVRAVERIKRECEEQNVRFSDPHFDIEEDLKISGRRDCLRGLVPDGCSSSIPGDVKRVQVSLLFQPLSQIQSF